MFTDNNKNKYIECFILGVYVFSYGTDVPAITKALSLLMFVIHFLRVNLSFPGRGKKIVQKGKPRPHEIQLHCVKIMDGTIY